MRGRVKNTTIYNAFGIMICQTLFAFYSYGQGEANIWYFGNFAGYDFNTTPPTFLANGAQVHLEGMATICDPTGKLLFYTTGVDVWDRLHRKMPNGNNLMGHWSSTHSAVIVPKPGNPDVFYIFTTDAGKYIDENVEGLRYTTVNLCENNGFGDVIASTKNKLLIKPSPEKVNAVYHRNGSDVWVITHAMDSDEFLAYLVTERGVNETPVRSKVGLFYSSDHLSAAGGQIKFSPDGRKVAMVTTVDLKLQIFDFDNQTGILTNPIAVYFYYPYGVEFSPDGSKLYVSYFENTRLAQLDLLSGSEIPIIQSIVPIAILNQESLNGLQLGPDGKIYDSSLGVIHKPNEKGTACEFEDRYLSKPPAFPQRGLSNFIQSYFDPNPYIVYSKQCDRDSFTFQIVNSNKVESITWNFDDPSSGAKNASTSFNPLHTFGSTGTYQVSASIKLKTGATIQKYKKVTWFDFTVNLGKDTTLCDATNYLLDAAQSEYACYLWHDGSTKPTFNAHQTGWHWVDVRVRGCTKRDSVFLRFEKTPVVNLGPDKILCEGEFITLDAQTADANHLWSTGNTEQKVTLNAPGIYWVDVFRDRCVNRDSITLIGQQKPVIDLPRDNYFCEGEALNISLSQPGVNYFWNTGSLQSSISITEPGEYWVRAELNSCLRYDTLYVYEIRSLEQAYIDTLICEGNTIELDVTRPPSSYVWSSGSDQPKITVTLPGLYEVNIMNQCYQKNLRFNVNVENCDCDLFVPNVFTPNDDGMNDYFSPLIHQRIIHIDLSVINRWGTEVFHSNNLNDRWDGLINNRKADAGVYYWSVRYSCQQDNGQIYRNKQGIVHLLR